MTCEQYLSYIKTNTDNTKKSVDSLKVVMQQVLAELKKLNSKI